jgi:hypothetical protein
MADFSLLFQRVILYGREIEKRPFQANLEKHSQEIRDLGGKSKAAEIVLQ